MQCSYCDIAYALADPNCRGCGAPKTADAVRRDLDIKTSFNFNVLASRDTREQSGGLLSYFERLERLGPAGIAGFVVTILGLVLILGPMGLIMLAIFYPKLKAAKVDWEKAMAAQRGDRGAS